MARRVKSTDLVQTLPLPTVQKLEKGAGEIVKPFDLSLTWKVKAADTGFAYSVYEMTLAPGNEIPIHLHPFAEFFYVLEGQVDAMGIDADGRLTWTELTAGDCANAPATAPHGLKNRSAKAAKFLSVSNFEHEKSFNDYQDLLGTERGRSMSEDQKHEMLMDIFAEQKIAFLDVPER